MKSALGLCVVLFSAMSLLAQTTTTVVHKKRSTRAQEMTTAEGQALKDAVAVQQQQIATQQQQLGKQEQLLAAQQQQIEQLKDEMQKRGAGLEQAQGKADEAASQVISQQQQTVSDLHSDVTDLKENMTNIALSLQSTQGSIGSPLALHFKGVTITPGGFLAAEGVWRSHALGSDINTPFNSVPMPGATAGRFTEFYGSGRQSRVSMLTEGSLSFAKLTGYVEADFLSAGITSNNNQSNSYSLRQRQLWGQAALNNGWSFTGGQMWSLVTETRKGVENRSEALPMVIDAQYNVGFSWARQFGFRVAKNFGNGLWWAASVENSQATLGGHLAPGQNNFVLGSQGNGGGLYNATANYSFNPSPDFITKLVIEPRWGHYEVFGLVSDFRDRIFPCGGAIVATNGVLPPSIPCGSGNIPNASGAYNNSRLGWGAGLNARGTLVKHIDVGFHALAGQGVGRYGTAGLPDSVARPDGVLVPVRNLQALSTLEYHSKQLDVYANVGGEYEARTAYLAGASGAGYGSRLFNNSGCYNESAPAPTVTNVDTPVSSTSNNPVGSGTVPTPGSGGTPLTPGFNPGNPPNCTGDTRSILEGTLGFWYRFYRGPKGTLQWGLQYSYIDRNTWSGTGGNPATGRLLISPSAAENQVLTSFRYYLP